MTREPAYKLDLPHVYSGKVRDIYDAGNNQYLMVTSDRISAFDVVMNQPVPDKGASVDGDVSILVRPLFKINEIPSHFNRFI
ncbi:MAG: hypothetical protein CM15mP49_21850 [Actinomycetota bacterium]|nr:MAG: hypothetical protein CM15mP49_21850 [Actinomycetota bacterium]